MKTAPKKVAIPKGTKVEPLMKSFGDKKIGEIKRGKLHVGFYVSLESNPKIKNLIDNVEDTLFTLANLIDQGGAKEDAIKALNENAKAWFLLVEEKDSKDSNVMESFRRIVQLADLARSSEAGLGAIAKLKNDVDGKQAAKQGVLLFWLERHNGKQRRLKTVEQFAIESMKRWPVLKSAKVICGWSAGWSRAIKSGKTPVC
jgi:hypothetical protein